MIASPLGDHGRTARAQPVTESFLPKTYDPAATEARWQDHHVEAV
ncbi:hypothetical protein [Synechococcus sp. BA-132 BA5]|nr:hypothetical protein [Synechococcus sp. BA-132 BA5]